ncbi:Gamma-glutamyltransferase 7 [Acipenser ruthenus]|uniref:Gamma-glutamyltransferase 7 n=1 Tax=Acipenser ruthenus TaxID=7906 RepID=A0A444UXJ2_ACIRT|nr:Gamma-glutamyltransferase 7 [Acipenser ruthenus]
MTEKDVRHETTLGAYSPVDYMSITSFPRLPEDDAVSAENNLRTRKDEDAFLSEQDTDPDLFLKSARLQRLPSSELGSQDVSPLRETHRDPLAGDCSCQHDGLTIIITACLTFATGVTVALIMQIYFGDPQIFIQGAVVTDVGRCSSLGVEVLKRQGSSVDAAIAAALCTGIINPHASGIGGMPWADVLSLTAEVARGGFNVTHDLAEAVSKMKEQNVSDSFREIFMPEGQRVLPGSLMRRLDLADILDSVGTEGVAAFYSSNLTQEMVAEASTVLRDPLTLPARERGGVLQEEDFSNYSVVIEKPLEGVYQGHQILAPPPPHAGAALIAALNILEGFNITSQVPRNSTYHWIAEVLHAHSELAQACSPCLHFSVMFFSGKRKCSIKCTLE